MIKRFVRSARRWVYRRFVLPSLVRRADALLASYPKSGRTWFRFVLSHYFAGMAKTGLQVDLHSMFTVVPNLDRDPERGFPAYRFAAMRPRLPLVAVTHLAYGQAFGGKPVVFMVRDPRDVMVSAYFHATRHKHRFSGGVDDFLFDERQGLPDLVRYLNGWADGLADTRHHVLSYEQMSTDPAAAGAGVLRFLGVSVDAALLDAAVRAASFDAMRELETAGGIPGHDYDRTDEQSLRMRKGKTGGFQETLTAKQVADIDAYCAAHLSDRAKTFLLETGYGAPPHTTEPALRGALA